MTFNCNQFVILHNSQFANFFLICFLSFLFSFCYFRSLFFFYVVCLPSFFFICKNNFQNLLFFRILFHFLARFFIFLFENFLNLVSLLSRCIFFLFYNFTLLYCLFSFKFSILIIFHFKKLLDLWNSLHCYLICTRLSLFTF